MRAWRAASRDANELELSTCVMSPVVKSSVVVVARGAVTPSAAPGTNVARQPSASPRRRPVSIPAFCRSTSRQSRTYLPSEKSQWSITTSRSIVELGTGRGGKLDGGGAREWGEYAVRARIASVSRGGPMAANVGSGSSTAPTRRSYPVPAAARSGSLVARSPCTGRGTPGFACTGSTVAPARYTRARTSPSSKSVLRREGYRPLAISHNHTRSTSVRVKMRVSGSPVNGSEWREGSSGRISARRSSMTSAIPPIVPLTATSTPRRPYAVPVWL